LCSEAFGVNGKLNDIWQGSTSGISEGGNFIYIDTESGHGTIIETQKYETFKVFSILAITMKASEIISEVIPPLVHTDSGEKALLWMDEFQVNHLPVLKNGNFVGVLSESELLDQADLEPTLDALFQHLPRPFVFADAHLFDILKHFSLFKLTALPVLDRQEQYLGVISSQDLLQLLAQSTGVKEIGSVLVLEMDANNYALSQIAQIVESNQAKILNLFVNSEPDSTKIQVSLKINQQNLSAIIRTFERYDYNVLASYQAEDQHNELQERYDELMLYLNM
jgi:signal-transduction protein with cAMP-binding, CBS, and nucleotidyltransferase domain